MFSHFDGLERDTENCRIACMRCVAL